MTVETLGRAVGLYRRAATSRSALVLLAANAIPLVGVLFFDWSLLTILVLYWIENGIVGFWNVPKIVMAQGSVVPTMLPELPGAAAYAATGNAKAAADLQARWQQARAAQQQEATTAAAARSSAAAGSPIARLASVGRVGLAMFFAFHYGMFWFVHGIFVFALPAFGNGFGLDDGGSFGTLIWSNVLLAAVVLFLSHGASFLFNYIGRGEYITSSSAQQMMSPYSRVIVLHLTIIFGSMVVAFLGAPIGALVVLIGVKTAFDLGLHLREHRASGPPLPAGIAGPA